MLLAILGIVILIIVISIYQKTFKIQEDVMALRRHFDLMTPQELEEEDIEKQLRGTS